jgi:hypothetical protein
MKLKWPGIIYNEERSQGLFKGTKEERSQGLIKGTKDVMNLKQKECANEALEIKRIRKIK